MVQYLRKDKKEFGILFLPIFRAMFRARAYIIDARGHENWDVYNLVQYLRKDQKEFGILFLPIFRARTTAH